MKTGPFLAHDLSRKEEKRMKRDMDLVRAVPSRH